MPAPPTKKKVVAKVLEDDSSNASAVDDVKKTKQTPLLKELQNASSVNKIVKTRNMRSSDIRTDGDSDASGASEVTKYKKGAVKRGIARTIVNKKNKVQRTRSSRRKGLGENKRGTRMLKDNVLEVIEFAERLNKKGF